MGIGLKIQTLISLSLACALFASSCKQKANDSSTAKATTANQNPDCFTSGMNGLKSEIFDLERSLPRVDPNAPPVPPPLDGEAAPMTEQEKKNEIKERRLQELRGRVYDCEVQQRADLLALEANCQDKQYRSDLDVRWDVKNSKCYCKGIMTNTLSQDASECTKPNVQKTDTSKKLTCPAGYYVSGNQCYPNSLISNSGKMTSCPTGQVLTTAGTCERADYRQLYDHCIAVGAVLHMDYKCHKGGQIVP